MEGIENEDGEKEEEEKTTSELMQSA
jgi:hypothetical protein